MSAESDEIVFHDKGPHYAVVATKLTVAFSIWAAVVAIAATLITGVLYSIANKVSEFQKQFSEFSVQTERRLTQLEDHDKLSDAERARNTAAIAKLESADEQLRRDINDCHRIK